VGEALADAGIFLFGLDYSVPPAEAPLEPGMAVTVHRVEERVEILRQSIPFETIWQPDPSLELDQTRLLRPGQEGISCWRYKLRIVDGQVQERVIQDTWVEQEPIDRLMAYGTAIVLREVQSPQGPQQYWRRMRVLVTSYSPKTAGLPRQSPHYGRTRTGKEAGTGVIAVDPSVIPLGTRIYVPGYGIGVAEDTGSMIRGRHIDVCYDDDELVSWYQWVDIYLLAPPPPPQLIRYLLPSWPKEE
jgi:3D (Asp-Asp-Asp) domain-containing protein